jgi:hypothetical protein
MPAVSVDADGNVHGVGELMNVEPAEAERLRDRRGEAFAEFVAKRHGRGLFASNLRVTLLAWVAPGVPGMVLGAVPAPRTEPRHL